DLYETKIRRITTGSIGKFHLTGFFIATRLAFQFDISVFRKRLITILLIDSPVAVRILVFFNAVFTGGQIIKFGRRHFFHFPPIFRVIVKGTLEAGTGTTRWIADDRSIFLPALGVGTFDLYGNFMTFRFAWFIFQDNKLLTVFRESLVAVVNIKSTVTFSIFVFFNGIFSWS